MRCLHSRLAPSRSLENILLYKTFLSNSRSSSPGACHVEWGRVCRTVCRPNLFLKQGRRPGRRAYRAEPRRTPLDARGRRHTLFTREHAIPLSPLSISRSSPRFRALSHTCALSHGGSATEYTKIWWIWPRFSRSSSLLLACKTRWCSSFAGAPPTRNQEGRSYGGRYSPRRSCSLRAC